MAEDKGSRNRGTNGSGDEQDLGVGPEGGKIRRGPDYAKSLKYSWEVTSTGDEPEREGRSLASTHQEVIKQWAEERDRVPATVKGTEHGDHAGVPRIDGGGKDDKLRPVSWED